MFEGTDVIYFLPLRQDVALDFKALHPPVQHDHFRHRAGCSAAAGRFILMPREAHDALFRALASDQRSAASLIRRYAPPALVQVLSDVPPRLQDSLLVRPRKGKVQADALFEVELRDGSKVLVQILFEHLSRWKRETPLKLLEYMLGAWWRNDRRLAPRSLKPLIPVLICHGLGSAEVPEAFMELYDVPLRLVTELNLLDFGIAVHELEHIPDRELADDPATRGALLAMKISRWEDPPLPVLLEILADLSDRSEDSLVRVEAMEYLLGTLKISETNQEALLEAQDEEYLDMALMTIAERLQMRSHAEGLAEGRAEERKELFLELLGDRFGHVPVSTVNRVRSAKPEELRYADDLESVFRHESGH